MSKTINVGDKMTIYDTDMYTNCRRVVGITVVSDTGKRVLRTSEGRRWLARGGEEVSNAHGTKIGQARIVAYQDGDDARAERNGLVLAARRLFRWHRWDADRGLVRLSDADLKTLSEIADRLEAAIKEGM